MNIGLYIGRFQPFHNGHKKIVDTMLEENETNVILIWLSEDEDKNPYSYWQRLHFFTHGYATQDTLHIYPLSDEESDEKWIENILSFPEIKNAEKITLYCWDTENDSAVKVIQEFQDMFPQHINIREISRKNIPLTWTEIRKNIHEKWLESEKNNIPLEVYEYLKWV